MWTSLFITSVSSITLWTMCNEEVLKIETPSSGLNMNFSLYMTCVVELQVSTSNYPSHFCLLSCLSCKKYRKLKKLKQKFDIVSHPPPPPFFSSTFYILMAISATIIIRLEKSLSLTNKRITNRI